jgi:hypothetical protein
MFIVQSVSTEDKFFYQLEGGELSRMDEQMFIQQEGRKE